jgi:regulator of sigma E protease
MNSPAAPTAHPPVRANWSFLVTMAIATIALYVWLGPDNFWAAIKVVVGLGFVIFIHELGHFAVAKWCDVHVETFSLGFGPAIPGLSFQKGETLYKIAWVPLGGYVKMVGEGAENDEEDDDPRSFKNKTVGQRMAIISAGVVMNVILGCICFILAYQGGVKVEPAVIGNVDPGSPAWSKGLRSGMVIKRVGDTEHPYFQDMVFKVMLSSAGERVSLVVDSPGDSSPRTIELEPRRESTDSKPVIGVTTPQRLQLATARWTRKKVNPVFGPAAAARRLDLRPGDVVKAASDPEHNGQMTPLPLIQKDGQSRTDYDALFKRFTALKGEAVSVQIVRADGREETQEVPAEGFTYGDFIIGMTDPDQQGAYDPFVVSELPLDPRAEQEEQRDYFKFRERLQRLTGKPIVILVRPIKAEAHEKPTALLVPPGHTLVIPGVRMKMGKVVAVRDSSSGSKAGVTANDRIYAIELTDGQETIRFASEPSKERPKDVVEKTLDPLRLPSELRAWAEGRSNVRAKLSVERNDPQTHRDGAKVTLPEVAWESQWQYDLEPPLSLTSPMSIAELGVAYAVETRVDEVEKGSEAAQKGIKEGDVILGFKLKEVQKKDKPAEWGPEIELYKTKNQPEAWWAAVFERVRDSDAEQIRLRVQRGDGDETIDLDLAPDMTWPQAERGFLLMPDQCLEKADSPLQAIEIGAKRTVQMIVRTYLSLRSMVTNRVSASKNLGGPITIAVTAFALAGEDWPQFLWFLAMISVNLAVVNFLPVPVLDGGHMVFLIYEKLRGRPASEGVRLGLTYLGLLLILSLMAFALFVDAKRFRLFG